MMRPWWPLSSQPIWSRCPSLHIPQCLPQDCTCAPPPPPPAQAYAPQCGLDLRVGRGWFLSYTSLTSPNVYCPKTKWRNVIITRSGMWKKCGKRADRKEKRIHDKQINWQEQRERRARNNNSTLHSKRGKSPGVGPLWKRKTVLSSDSLFLRVHILCQSSQDHTQA